MVSLSYCLMMRYNIHHGVIFHVYQTNIHEIYVGTHVNVCKNIFNNYSSIVIAKYI